jgi:glutathione synthase
VTETVFVLVNAALELEPTQTTAMLVRAAAATGRRVAVAGVGDVELAADASVWARCRCLPPGPLPDTREAVTALRAAPAEWVDLGAAALALLRTNPARDEARARLHEAALGAMARLAAAGVPVVNDPEGLRRAAGKLVLARLPPDCRPPTLVTRDLERARAFVAAFGPACVLKPLHGTRGRAVFFIDGPDTPNLPALLETLARDGYAVLQPRVEGAEQGDTRVVLLDGALLEVDGVPAALRRVPAAGDLRSNLHAGGHAEPAAVDARMREVIQTVGPTLAADGLRLVGLDFIGDLVIEANVFSTGGLRDAERFGGVDFAGAIVRRLLVG